MDPDRHYREAGYGYSSSSHSSGRYQPREVSPGPSRHESSRYPSYRSVSPMGSSRFEREYLPPSMSPSRVAERNAPVGPSSFYSRPHSSCHERERPDFSRHESSRRPSYGSVSPIGTIPFDHEYPVPSRERRASPSRRPSTGSQCYGGVDLSSLGGGFDGVRSGYGGMYGGSSRREHSSSRHPSYGAREMPDFSRGPYGGHGTSSGRRSPADILGSPFSSGSSSHSSRYDSGYERSSSSSRHPSPSRTLYDYLDSAAPRGSHSSAHSSRSHRYY